MNAWLEKHKAARELKRAKGQRRFFYHFAKCRKEMTVHFIGSCYPCKNVICNVPCETKWDKKQPLLVMQGFCSNIEMLGDTIYIS